MSKTQLKQSFRTSTQAVIAWDGVALTIEVANRMNGARKKVEGVAFHDLPWQIQQALGASLIDAQAAKERLAQAPSSANSRIDPQIARDQRIQRAKEDADKAWSAYLDRLSPRDREREIEKRAERKRKIAEEEQRVRNSVYLNTMRDHGIPLANRVVDDPSKRPSRKVVVIGKNGGALVSPRKLRDDGSQEGSRQVLSVDDFDL